MSGVGESREVLANAVSSTGLACAPYAPDSFIAPAAWVDSVIVDYENGASMCLTGAVEAVIIAAGQRNDRAGSSQMLEELMPDVITALEGVPGVRVIQIQSGTAEVNGQTLPAVLYTCQYHIS